MKMRKKLFTKRIIELFLIAVLLLSFAGCGAGDGSTAENSPNDFEYEEVSGGLNITKYVGKSNVVVIPSVIDNKKVVSLSEAAFSGDVMLKEITLPDSFSDISFSYFKNCASLEKIVYTGTVSRIIGTNSSLLSDILHTLDSFRTLEIYAIKEELLGGEVLTSN